MSSQEPKNSSIGSALNCPRKEDVVLELPKGKFVRRLNRSIAPRASFAGGVSQITTMGGALLTCLRDEEEVHNIPYRRNDLSSSLIVDEECTSNHGTGMSLVDVIDANKDAGDEAHNDTILNVIDKVWEKISTGLIGYKKYYEQQQQITENKGWKIIRLFISSTFTDFHAEREILVKKVMPELKEWCEQYKVHLLECDLRWGVPKNTDTEETISICLDEIDRCIQGTHGKPFFLNMLGERYGWIPTLDYLSEELIAKYDWIYPISITHMEILHGALRTDSPNSLFMIRNEESLDNLPEQFRKFFKDDMVLANKSLQRLKKELATRFPNQTFRYESKISGTDNSTGMEKVTFDNLDEFATTVLEFYKTRILNYLSTITSSATGNEEEKQAEMSEMDQFSIMQEAFIGKRGQWLIGRKEEVKAMMNFVQNINDDNKSEKCLLIIAEPGTGKSSLVANHVLKLNEANIPCLYNFSSSAPGSTNSTFVLQRFCEELSAKLKTNPPDRNKQSDYVYLKEYFQEHLQKINEEMNGFTIILDAINQFNDSCGQEVDWLPLLEDNSNIRYVISCTPNYNGFKQVQEKFRNISKEILLSGFDEKCRGELVEGLFLRYNKKLDDEQMRMLISLNAASSPLWLALACEELRVFGVFEQVTQRIRMLPDSIIGLVKVILDRIIEEDETAKVRQVLSYLASSYSGGFTESELRYLLSDAEDGIVEPLPLMIWAKVRRQVKPFLMTTGTSVLVYNDVIKDEEGFISGKGHLKSTGEEDIYSFFHAAVNETVLQSYLQETDECKQYHKRIANYYLQNNIRRGAAIGNAIFKHLESGELYKELVEFCRKDSRSFLVDDHSKSRAFAKIRCQRHVLPGKSQFQSSVYMCRMCSTKSKLLSQRPIQTKDSCIVCGAWVPWKKVENEAFVCSQHKTHSAPKTDKCYFCKNVIFLEQKSVIPLYSNCYLCTLCRFRNTCIQIVT